MGYGVGEVGEGDNREPTSLPGLMATVPSSTGMGKKGCGIVKGGGGDVLAIVGVTAESTGVLVVSVR